MEKKERWQYYVSSYIRIEPTEGVNRQLMKPALLTRHLPKHDSADFEDALQRKPLVYNEDLTMRICVNTSRIVYDKDSGSEYFIYADQGSNDAAKKKMERATRERNASWRDVLWKLSWARDLEQKDIDVLNEDFYTRFGKPEKDSLPAEA